jgi:lysophospholipase L1-like esterase
MKFQKFLMLMVGMGFWFAIGFARAQNSTITIMPMGDSVTARGSFPESSYRYWLWVDLTNAGFTNIAFVGNQNGVSDGAPANSWPQENYEGGGPSDDAWTTADGINNAASAAGMGPQILLLDLGSNDIINGTPMAQIQTNLQTIVETFAADDPGVIIILAVPSGFPPDPSSPIQVQHQQKADQSRMGGVVSKVVSIERKAGTNISKVNLLGGYNIRTDTKDGTHPNIQGEQLLAKRYFNALRPIIKKMIKNGA